MTTLEERAAQIAKQVRHEQLADLFVPMYDLAEALTRFVLNDVRWRIPPLMTFEEERGKRGSYRPTTTWGDEHVINLNPFMHDNAWEMAQTLCHEMLHMWQQLINRPTVDGVHTDEFNERMWTLFGIRTKGEFGDTTALDHVRFNDLLIEMHCDPQSLELILLPGKNRKEPRRMFKHTCPTCGVSFHARKKMNVICGACHSSDDDDRFVVTR